MIKWIKFEKIITINDAVFYSCDKQAQKELIIKQVIKLINLMYDNADPCFFKIHLNNSEKNLENKDLKLEWCEAKYDTTNPSQPL